MAKIESVQLVIKFADGRSCQAQITEDGVSRWGATRETLGDAVAITEAMSLAASDFFEEG